MSPYRYLFFLFVIGLSGCANYSTLSSPSKSTVSSPVAHLIPKINRQFLSMGITEGKVVVDDEGLLTLAGEYQDDNEVNKAFVIAREIAGEQFISPVTPEHIKNTNIGDIPPTNTIANKYALVVGVGKFKYLPKEKELKYAKKDAEAVERFLTSTKGGRFLQQNVVTLINENATSETIENALLNLQYKAKADDLVFVYFSSHGSDPQYNQGGVDVITYDTTDNANGYGNTITRGFLSNFMFGIQSKRLVVVADICHSGDITKELLGFKSINKEQGLGMKDLFPVSSTQENTKSNYNKWGKIFMSASSADQRSYEPFTVEEKKEIGNSYFTHYFLKGLEKSHGDIRAAFNQAKNSVVTIKRQSPEIKTRPASANIQLQ